eukprot:TRINITY_DN26470_c0_g1_i2.p1 TRINITY_DN26470_c0_g1~~TRINITY_DN26470_c0_g1_i2.p1  ORF type:complete len:611 (-),score=73.85 TRINITY_DN26470_c0_g1_i2:75-1907(-)
MQPGYGGRCNVLLALGLFLGAAATCCDDTWFQRAMAELNGPYKLTTCGSQNVTLKMGNAYIHDWLIHCLAIFTQIYARKILLPRNTTHFMRMGVLYHSSVVYSKCPAIVHLFKLLESEVVLLAALPSLSDATPWRVRSAVLEEAASLAGETEQYEDSGYTTLERELVAEAKQRLRRFRAYVQAPGSWLQPSWHGDVDVTLAHLWHVRLKECRLPDTNFSIGEMYGSRKNWMAVSPPAWEEAMLLVLLALKSLPDDLRARVRYVAAGGTLLGLMRYGSGVAYLESDLIDFVDKDIDVLILADSASDWWDCILAIQSFLMSNGWAGCSHAIRDAYTLPAGRQLAELGGASGMNLVSRGVSELVCAFYTTDHSTLQQALVPFNAVWIQAFHADGLQKGRQAYRPVSFDSPEVSVFMSSSACSGSGHCFALPHFPFQAWRGRLPANFLRPFTQCLFTPLMPHFAEQLGSNAFTVPCPQASLGVLRGYDRGELWARVEGRPCLALPLVIKHDRVNNNDTRRLQKQGLSPSAVKHVMQHMERLEKSGGINLLEDMKNCTLQPDGGYRVLASIFKGTTTGEVDCAPRVSKMVVDWNSPERLGALPVSTTSEAYTPVH